MTTNTMPAQIDDELRAVLTARARLQELRLRVERAEDALAQAFAEAVDADAPFDAEEWAAGDDAIALEQHVLDCRSARS